VEVTMSGYQWNMVKVVSVVGIAAMAYLLGTICSALLFD
jgi:hypothetical protein